MAKVNFIKGLNSNLPEGSVAEGTFCLSTDTKVLFYVGPDGIPNQVTSGLQGKRLNISKSGDIYSFTYSSEVTDFIAETLKGGIGYPILIYGTSILTPKFIYVTDVPEIHVIYDIKLPDLTGSFHAIFSYTNNTGTITYSPYSVNYNEISGLPWMQYEVDGLTYKSSEVNYVEGKYYSLSKNVGDSININSPVSNASGYSLVIEITDEFQKVVLHSYNASASTRPWAITNSSGVILSIYDWGSLPSAAHVETILKRDLPNNAKYIVCDSWAHTGYTGHYAEIYTSIVSETKNRLLQINPLRGKKVVVFGDSIVEGVDNRVNSVYTSFADYLKLYGCEVTKLGVGGSHLTPASLAAQSTFNGYSVYHLVNAWVTQNYTVMDATTEYIANSTQYGDRWAHVPAFIKSTTPANYDIVIIHAGTNDWNNALRVIGNWSDTNPVYNYTCTLKSVINGLRSVNPNIQVVVVSPLVRWMNYGDNPNTSDFSDNSANPTSGLWLPDVAGKMVEVAIRCKAYGINAYQGLGVNETNFASLFTVGGVHPNNVGQLRLTSLIANNLSTNVCGVFNTDHHHNNLDLLNNLSSNLNSKVDKTDSHVLQTPIYDPNKSSDAYYNRILTMPIVGASYSVELNVQVSKYGYPMQNTLWISVGSVGRCNLVTLDNSYFKLLINSSNTECYLVGPIVKTINDVTRYTDFQIIRTSGHEDSFTWNNDLIDSTGMTVVDPRIVLKDPEINKDSAITVNAQSYVEQNGDIWYGADNVDLDGVTDIIFVLPDDYVENNIGVYLGTYNASTGNIYRVSINKNVSRFVVSTAVEEGGETNIYNVIDTNYSPTEYINADSVVDLTAIQNTTNGWKISIQAPSIIGEGDIEARLENGSTYVSNRILRSPLGSISIKKTRNNNGGRFYDLEGNIGKSCIIGLDSMTPLEPDVYGNPSPTPDAWAGTSAALDLIKASTSVMVVCSEVINSYVTDINYVLSYQSNTPNDGKVLKFWTNCNKLYIRGLVGAYHHKGENTALGNNDMSTELNLLWMRAYKVYTIVKATVAGNAVWQVLPDSYLVDTLYDKQLIGPSVSQTYGTITTMSLNRSYQRNVLPAIDLYGIATSYVQALKFTGTSADGQHTLCSYTEFVKAVLQNILPSYVGGDFLQYPMTADDTLKAIQGFLELAPDSNGLSQLHNLPECDIDIWNVTEDSKDGYNFSNCTYGPSSGTLNGVYEILFNAIAEQYSYFGHLPNCCIKLHIFQTGVGYLTPQFRDSYVLASSGTSFTLRTDLKTGNLDIEYNASAATGSRLSMSYTPTMDWNGTQSEYNQLNSLIEGRTYNIIESV